MARNHNSKRITISFSSRNIDIYEFIIKQSNISNYICELIREKIQQNQKEEDTLFMQQVTAIVKDILKDMNMGNIEKDIGVLGVLNDEIESEMTKAMEAFDF